MQAFCLSIHAGYRCGRSGACCTAGWPIPAEAHTLASIGRRGVRLHPEPPAGGAVLLPRRTDGACLFYDTEGDGLCGLQKDDGPQALPVSCRNFPRVTLHDARGVFVTLSAFCPTVARLLVSAADIRIVSAPASMTLDGAVEGLDATTVLPPLLRAGILMDLAGYAAWEQEAIATMNDRRLPARAARAVVAGATGAVLEWMPGRGSLADAVGCAFARARATYTPNTVPLAPLEHAAKAFLASHLFGSWAAYQGGGLWAVVEEMDSAAAFVEAARDTASFVAAVRAADLHLRHGL